MGGEPFSPHLWVDYSTHKWGLQAEKRGVPPPSLRAVPAYAPVLGGNPSSKKRRVGEPPEQARKPPVTWMKPHG